MWMTEAPLGTDQRQDHLKRLMELLDRMAVPTTPGIILQSMKVWVDGVPWEYEKVRTF